MDWQLRISRSAVHRRYSGLPKLTFALFSSCVYFFSAAQNTWKTIISITVVRAGKRWIWNHWIWNFSNVRFDIEREKIVRSSCNVPWHSQIGNFKFSLKYETKKTPKKYQKYNKHNGWERIVVLVSVCKLTLLSLFAARTLWPAVRKKAANILRRQCSTTFAWHGVNPASFLRVSATPELARVGPSLVHLGPKRNGFGEIILQYQKDFFSRFLNLSRTFFVSEVFLQTLHVQTIAEKPE